MAMTTEPVQPANHRLRMHCWPEAVRRQGGHGNGSIFQGGSTCFFPGFSCRHGLFHQSAFLPFLPVSSEEIIFPSPLFPAAKHDVPNQTSPSSGLPDLYSVARSFSSPRLMLDHIFSRCWKRRLRRFVGSMPAPDHYNSRTPRGQGHEPLLAVP
ncbi:uncharacterized protein BO95DRAFT_121116 [Aspergillus brunneoviolaceus CBS 621.78]|uniref:Uncharacterized protein n=1 Tax=Aspergillus brunneoviolaceus CBS 621.78 TaxID=1450534 RepID=A0ACD1G9N6_9EURO|nr:hypothetical protein BO95DRAFT_121116 [Aspergillus brunneoviolaceus CBS 621.78]RAH46004.1 hypothetical protein BO95DRAFT_121116 [Aspergillus brunneoviolaceus CBS 621.78]